MTDQDYYQTEAEVDLYEDILQALLEPPFPTISSIASPVPTSLPASTASTPTRRPRAKRKIVTDSEIAKQTKNLNFKIKPITPSDIAKQYRPRRMRNANVEYTPPPQSKYIATLNTLRSNITNLMRDPENLKKLNDLVNANRSMFTIYEETTPPPKPVSEESRRVFKASDISKEYGPPRLIKARREATTVRSNDYDNE